MISEKENKNRTELHLQRYEISNARYDELKAFVVAARAFSKAATIIRAYVEAIICLYPNKRIAWLALHHNKARIRKKNIKRILKEYRKEDKNGLQSDYK